MKIQTDDFDALAFLNRARVCPRPDFDSLFVNVIRAGATDAGTVVAGVRACLARRLARFGFDPKWDEVATLIVTYPDEALAFAQFLIDRNVHKDEGDEE